MLTYRPWKSNKYIIINATKSNNTAIQREFFHLFRIDKICAILKAVATIEVYRAVYMRFGRFWQSIQIPRT